MPRERTGYVFEDDGKWYARVTFVDKSGQRRNIKRRADNKTDAKILLKRLNKDVDSHGAAVLDSGKITFTKLADYYEREYIVGPIYADGMKVSGLRSAEKVRGHLKPLRAFFGKQKLSSITFDVIKRYRDTRLQTPVIRGKAKVKSTRAIASVNRELALLRRMLVVAKREQWIRQNPFEQGVLILSSAEKKRERILSRDEEERLLAACTGPRAHIRPILICALDTGMRRGELLSLIWSDVNLEAGLITVRAFNTKTERERQVGMTARLKAALLDLWNKSFQSQDASVFGIEDNFYKAFRRALKDAGITGFTFHDARHSAATRLIQRGMSLAEVGRILGHTQAQTTFRYANVDRSSIEKAARLLDEFNES